jgi:hypothetical protein
MGLQVKNFAAQQKILRCGMTGFCLILTQMINFWAKARKSWMPAFAGMTKGWNGGFR